MENTEKISFNEKYEAVVWEDLHGKMSIDYELACLVDPPAVFENFGFSSDLNNAVCAILDTEVNDAKM